MGLNRHETRAFYHHETENQINEFLTAWEDRKIGDFFNYDFTMKYWGSNSPSSDQWFHRESPVFFHANSDPVFGY